MRRCVVRIAAAAILLFGIWTTIACADNFLESGILRYVNETEDDIEYNVFMTVNKDEATTCQLETPSGTYSFTDEGDAFRPEPAYLDDYIGLSFADLEIQIAEAWTLTWDAGPTQTVVTIDFGTIAVSEFLPFTELTAPAGGGPIEIPGGPNPPTIEWINGSGPPDCGFATAFLTDQKPWWDSQTRIDSDDQSCTTTSWTPASPLSDGSWFVTVLNGTDVRDVPVCITVVEGEWPLDNEGWLNLVSIAPPPSRADEVQ